jgi:hypothetical protein
MPKTSAAASEVLPFALSGHPLPAPDYLTDEQRRFWHDLVNPFPPEKIWPGCSTGAGRTRPTHGDFGQVE